MKCKNIDCSNLAKTNKNYCSSKCKARDKFKKYIDVYCDKKYSTKKLNNRIYEREYLNSYKKCIYCTIEFRVYKGWQKKKFCNNSCATSYNNANRLTSEESKAKKSNKLKKLWKEGHYQKTSANNWKKAIKTNKKMFSSKNERMIVEYFKANFPDDKWKSGGGIKYKGVQISRDLYSDKLKVCVEYDGIWHFVDIKGQLENKKRKDSALQEWCLEKGYRLIRVDEDAFAGIGQVVELVYNRIDKIIKIGNRYLP